VKKTHYMTIVLPVLLIQACTSRVDTAALVSEPKNIQTVKTEHFYSDRNISSSVENNWLKTFNDKYLDSLAQEALQKNPNLRVASFAVAEAVAQTTLAAAALKPTVGYNAGVSNTSTGTNSSSAIGASWQPDVWGRVSAQVESSLSSQRAIEADYAFAKQSLVADVSKAWFALIESTKQEKLSAQILKDYEATLDIVKTKFEVGQVLRKDVAQANADLNAAKDSHIQAKNALQNSSRALELLLGRYPSAEISAGVNLPQLSAFPATGVPADLLQRRPDLISKEEQLRAAFFATKDAELSRLPTFTLSVGGGINNAQNFIGLLAAGISGPVYTGGAIEAQIKAADASQKRALASYESTILSAFKDVETSLANEKVLQDRSEVLSLAVKDYESALKDTKIQYELGQIDLTFVQIAQRKLNASRSTNLHVKSLLLQNRVNMYLALGGGFDNKDAAQELKRSIKEDKQQEEN